MNNLIQTFLQMLKDIFASKESLMAAIAVLGLAVVFPALAPFIALLIVLYLINKLYEPISFGSAEDGQPVKKWYKSATNWFNIILILTDTINQSAQFIPIPPHILSYIGLAGIALRSITKTAVK